MELIKPSSIAIGGKPLWPNTVIFPKELRDAIPDYGPRALIFDSVSGSHNSSPTHVSGLADANLFDFGPRARVQFLVHETGKLDGKFAVLMDLDSTTTRALGQFLVELADRAERKEN